MKFAMDSGLRVVLGVGIAERNKAAPRYSIKHGEGREEGKGDKMSVFLCLQFLFTRSDHCIAIYSRSILCTTSPTPDRSKQEARGARRKTRSKKKKDEGKR